MTEDEKHYDIAVAAIRRHSIDSEDWRLTCIGGLHHSFGKQFVPNTGELVIASALIASDNWYVFTTRRLISCFHGIQAEANISKLNSSNFENFKGYGSKMIEVATCSFLESPELKFEYETGKASMAPIYAAKYWQNKN